MSVAHEEFDWDAFMRDTNDASIAATGAWMRCLYKMRHSVTPGRLTRTLPQYARLFGSTVDQAKAVVDEIVSLNIGDADEADGQITLTNRRMYRKHLSQKSNENGGLQPHPKLDIISSSSKKNVDKEEEKNNSNVASVFGFWQSVLNHPQARLTIERRRAIQGRLKEGYSVDDLKRAVSGCKASRYHMGENDHGKVYDDIELICRNGSKVEQFQSYLTAKGKPSIVRQRGPGWTCQNCGRLACLGCEETIAA